MNSNEMATMGNRETALTVGSTPSVGTKIIGVFEETCPPRTETAQEGGLGRRKMHFPITVKFRGQKAKIYGRTASYPHYRVSYRSGGKRILQTFSDFTKAKDAAERAAKEIWKGLESGLTPRQTRDARDAASCLEEFHRATGRRLSIYGAVRELTSALVHLPPGRTLAEAVDSYVLNSGCVKPIDVAEAVKMFIAEREPLTLGQDGKRPQLSPDYHRISAGRLEDFAAANPAHQIGDLTKNHLDSFFKVKLAGLSPKTRNHFRGIIGTFFKWCVAKDFLPANHRLGEAAGMKSERADGEEIELYTPKQFVDVLAAAPADLKPVLAIMGLTGLRTAELLRLDWSDLRRIPGFVEVRPEKSKTRARRLIPLAPSLSAWLEPCKELSGPVWTTGEDALQARVGRLFDKVGIKRLQNGLRHSFVSYCYAVHGERAAAEQAGHSSAVLYANYRGLATPEAGQAWFAVAPGAENTEKPKV